jgi:succinate-semialdehyde dehydrogenase/glutarate-semialdehyde dehydrogenase
VVTIIQRRTVGGSLLRRQAYIGGQWLDAGPDSQIVIENPSTGQVIATVPNFGRAETAIAIAAASDAQPAWAALTPLERGTPLRRWAAAMRERQGDLASILTLEQGKPLAEAEGEIRYAASFLDWFAAEAERIDGRVIPSHIAGRRLFALRTPVGVTAAITPWNFPSAMITRKAGAALAAGCAMVVRPASETPLSALALAVLAEESGIPPGIFSVVTGDPIPFAEEIAASTVVRHLSFTGSTRVGKILLAQSASTVKRVAMELGGHAPLIVFEDADLDGAVEGAIDAKFQTSGQDCLAANRILVAAPLYRAFVERFTARTRALRVGDGFANGVEIGPLIGSRAIASCQAQVDDACAQGARLLCGGSSGDPGPLFFQPTVLADVEPGMRIWHEETFGPVAAITPFDTVEQALRLANDSDYGLAAYLWGKDISRLWSAAERIACGMIAINGVRMTGPPAPFGGLRQSGLGREGAREGIDEYLDTKLLCINGIGEFASAA